MTDQEIRSSLTDIQTLALTIWGESRSEEIEGKVAVGCIVRNRANDPKRWPDDIKGVCLEKLQFSCWQPVGGPMNYKAVMALARGLVEDYAIRTTVAKDSVFRECHWIAEGIVTGIVRDRLSGSNHYITRQMWETGPPSWAKGKSPTAFILRHVFFRL